MLGEFFRGWVAGGAVLGELCRECGLGGLVSGGVCTVLPQSASLGGTRDRCCGCLKEAAKVGEEARCTRIPSRPQGTPHAASNDPYAEAPGAVAPGAPGNR